MYPYTSFAKHDDRSSESRSIKSVRSHFTSIKGTKRSPRYLYEHKRVSKSLMKIDRV